MEIYTIGGFSEVGRNMTLVDLGEDAFIFDLGIFLPAIVELQEQETIKQEYTEKKLRNIG
ncbi:ribonuclease J, partial [Candidatus Woesearchaeota archaeon]|nr:ribonuclease J [Candidatus Woesearchaeota archaeon]